jgi:hypothetical protein
MNENTHTSNDEPEHGPARPFGQPPPGDEPAGRPVTTPSGVTDQREHIAAVGRQWLRLAAELRAHGAVSKFDPRAGRAATAVATAARSGALRTRQDVEWLLDGIDARDVIASLAVRLVVMTSLIPGLDVDRWLADSALMSAQRLASHDTPKGE